MNKLMSEMSKSFWAQKTPEERSAIAKKRAKAIWAGATEEQKAEKAAQLAAGRKKARKRALRQRKGQ